MIEAALIFFSASFSIWGLPVILGSIIESTWRKDDLKKYGESS